MGKINENEYLSKIIDTYGNLVYSICYKLTGHYFDAQDLTQDTFLAVYKNHHSFDGQNERAWICKIATNKCLDYLKKKGRQILPTENTYFYELKSQEPTPEEIILENQRKEDLYSMCCELKEPYKEVALNYFYNEMTVNEISAATGKNKKTLHTQIHRAKDMLKNLWRREIL